MANHVFASAASSGGKVLVGTLSGVYERGEASMWNRLEPDAASSVAFSPYDENIFYAGLDWRLGKSTDSGQSWTYIDISSDAKPHFVSSISISRQDPRVLFLGASYSCGCQGEIYKSTNSGTSISRSAVFNVPVNAVQVNPQNHLVVYAGTGMPFSSVPRGGVYKSSDGGSTWESILSFWPWDGPLEPPITGVVVNSLAIDPSDPEIIYAGCGLDDGNFSGVFKSTDGGVTWERKSFGLPDYASIKDIAIDPENADILCVATSRHGIYISHDGGNYWTLLGLSDYWLYDILSSYSTPLASKDRAVSGSSHLPSSELYAGSGSGILEYSGSGIGVVTGMVTDGKTGTGITGGALSTDTGGIALSLDGAYVMVLPAGVCTVTASMDGYQSCSRSGVVVTAGGDATVDLSLMPLSSPNMKSIQTNLVGPPAPGANIQITFTPCTQSDIYYRWYSRSGIGTANPGSWQMLADWSVNNNDMAWSPSGENRYLVLAHVAGAANSSTFHQIGLTFETQGNSTNPIQITGMTTTLADPQPGGIPITLTSVATGGSGPLYYKYFYRAGTGGWNELGGWNTDSNAALTPPSNGEYTIVVHVADNPAAANNPFAQAGMTCTIGE